MSKVLFSPSLMTMDLDKFKEQIEFLNQHVDSYHIDIMDGHYVPNLTLSPLRKYEKSVIYQCLPI